MEKHTGELDDFVVNRLKKILEFMLFDGDTQQASTISKAIDIIIDQKAEIETMRAYIHDNGLEWDLLSYSKRNGG